jgi:hypothetical protein
MDEESDLVTLQHIHSQARGPDENSSQSIPALPSMIPISSSLCKIHSQKKQTVLLHFCTRCVASKLNRGI